MRQCDNAGLKVIINHGLQTKLRNYLIKEISLRNKLLNLDLQHMILLIKGIRIMLINKLIKITKEDYFKTKLGNAKNSYDSWQAINSLLNKRSKTTEIPELQIENRSVKGDENIASCFNDYFSTVGSKLASNVTGIDSDPLRFVPPVTNTFYFQNISVLELTKTIAQIKIKKSPGIDGIYAKLLKDAGDTINESLVSIFNLSLQSGIFPDDWKLARVTPIYKDGSKTECGN
jgi:hypothetical protein